MRLLASIVRHVALGGLLFMIPPAAVLAEDAGTEEFFEKRIRPVLAETCFPCHGGQKVAGGLRVDAREALLRGGESGAAVDLQEPKKSLLLAAIQRDDNVSAMPPDKPLPAEQVADLIAWIAAGAPWPSQAAKFEVKMHWAFEPIQKPRLPEVSDRTWPRTSIDAFILASLDAAESKPSPPADRRTLLRRLTYDLTGLPPTAEEVAAFEQDDLPTAYADVVDRLLASPAYGEHWGRHWLDVVRYADTAGENSDHPLPHAWRYRNWVIEALNRDLPYDEFIRQQIAGDLVAAEGAAELASERIIATGYLAIARRFGHDIEKDMHLTLEDTIDTLGKSVLGLSLGCCRCHDHKYDPLTARDYYGLLGIFESTRFPFPGCEPQQQPRDLVTLPLAAGDFATVKQIEQQLARLADEEKHLLAQQAKASDEFVPAANQAMSLLAKGEIDDGNQAALAAGKQRDLEKISVKQGEVLLLTIGPRGNHGADSTLVEFEIVEEGESPRRWNVSELVADLPAGNPHPDTFGNAKVWCFLDLHAGARLLPESLSQVNGQHDLQAWRNGDTPSVFVNRSDKPVSVWTQLPPKAFLMHPGPQAAVGIAWISPINGTIALSGRIADAHPGGPDGVAWQLEHLAASSSGHALTKQGGIREKLTLAGKRRAELEASRPAPALAYAVAEGKPHHSRVHKRGEPTNLGDEVPRKFVDLLGGQQIENANQSGRLELARWLTDPANPLTARVIVNRVWQWHFGRGIVATPNDFGTRGAEPTHPALLDHLAAQFVESGWSLKTLHREMVLSATYQQAAGNPALASQYAAFSRRRLNAEELRDTLLVAGGNLDRSPGEAHPFPPQATWSFTQHAPFAAEYDTNKRSVYVMQKRNRRHRFFALFDGPDPNASTPTRDFTTVPTQALYFLNDPFVHAQAKRLAQRILAAEGGDQARLEFAYSILLGRKPAEEERQNSAQFFHDYSAALTGLSQAECDVIRWQAYARVLLSSSEVFHVD